MNWFVFLGILIGGVLFMIQRICNRMLSHEEIIEKHNGCFGHVEKSLDMLLEAIRKLDEKKEDKK